MKATANIFQVNAAQRFNLEVADYRQRQEQLAAFNVDPRILDALVATTWGNPENLENFIEETKDFPQVLKNLFQLVKGITSAN